MDGATGGQKTAIDPEGLLRSALEKIVFFECRVSQLEAELAAARDAALRARGDAAKAERRALELEHAIAGEKGARAEADRRASELHDRVRLLEAERERLLGGLVERARVSGAAASSGEPGPEEGGADLAGFIAELRAEIETLRAFRAEAEGAGFRAGAASRAPLQAHVDSASTASANPLAPAPAGERATASAAETSAARTVSDLATSFEASGRVGLTSRDTGQLKDLLTTRADRTLYERSMDDLASPDAGRRVRAVRALEALGSRAAAPLLAAALGREETPEVKAALLGALARFREPFAAELAERQLSDARPAVRVAALETLAAVAAGAAGDRLSAALSDESPVVRRRAALLLGLQAGDRAEDALAVALGDADRGVARAAAVALSGRPSAHAQSALARALEHGDASVRKAAGAALSRVCGEPVEADGPLSARRAASRRIAERLAGMGGEELRSAVLRSVATASPAAPRAAAATPHAPTRVPSPLPRAALVPAAEREGRGERVPRPPARAAAVEVPAARPSARTAVAEAPAAGRGPDLAPLILGEIRASLRGCTTDNLAALLGEPAARIEAALGALAASGAVAQRGTRWFMS